MTDGVLDGDDLARLVWIILILMLICSTIVARRMPFVRLVGWCLGWAVLFLGAHQLFRLIEPHITAWQQARRGGDVSAIGHNAASPQQTAGARGTLAQGATVAIAMHQDGHYWVDASINGLSVRFLINTGATVTAVSQSAADELGLPPDPMNRGAVLQTANGPVNARRSVIAAMQIDTIQVTDLPVVVSASFGDTNVLGMNFLSKLRSWRVENGTMILEPQ
jgi:aspartyl protease family protein